MEQLQKFNLKLLAVLSVFALVFFGLMILAIVVFFVNSHRITDDNKKADDNSIKVKDADTVHVEKQKLRERQITFGTPQLIDTLRSIYLVPVSQVNLGEPERIKRSSKILGLVDGNDDRESVDDDEGLFNNILVYNQKSQAKIPVFNKKVMISLFENKKIDGKNYILIEGTTYDSNKDGKLNSSDLKSFFIFNIHKNTLKEYGFTGMSLIDYNVLYKSSKIILRFGVDKDKDGEYESTTEPAILKIIKINNPIASDFIDDKLLKDIQALID